MNRVTPASSLLPLASSPGQRYKPWLGTISKIVVLFVIAFLNGCASHPDTASLHSAIVVPDVPPGSDETNTPVFYIHDSDQDYNRIGTPAVIQTADNKPEVIVDHRVPAVFYGTESFDTDKGHYTNLIYRIHFEKVPFGWGKFNLTAGKNPGILVIYTLSSNRDLVLITTVHSCGCYLAFFPTTTTPEDAYPDNWPESQQEVFGYLLPSLLQEPRAPHKEQVMFHLDTETHRIRDVLVMNQESFSADEIIPSDTFPIDNLYRLPFNGSEESFFELSGDREGYVKNNTKWLERILMGWWAFDFRVGEDKAYGGSDNSDVPLYTSLKFWAREASDLKNFAQFLLYWGWNL